MYKLNKRGKHVIKSFITSYGIDGDYTDEYFETAEKTVNENMFTSYTALTLPKIETNNGKVARLNLKRQWFDIAEDEVEVA